MMSPERLMLAIVSNVREDYRKMFPKDAKNNDMFTQILHNLAWRVKEIEDKKEKIEEP